MINLLSATLALLPTYLVRFSIGPLPTTLLEVMIWILIIMWLARGKQSWHELAMLIKNNRALAIVTCIFLTGATIGAGVSPNLRAALGEWRAFYVEPIIVAIIVATTARTQKDWHKLAVGLIIGGTATAILAVYQHFTGWLVPHSFWANQNSYRVTAWYGFPNAVGLWLAMLMPIAAYVTTQKNQWRWLGMAYLPLGLAGIIFAKSTAGLMGIAAAIGITLVVWRKTRWFAVAAALVALVSVFLLPAQSNLKQELLAQNRSGQLRRDMWSETLTYLKLHPIRGTGLAAYTSEIRPFRQDKRIEVFHHPHNIFLTIWVNTGAIGLLGFIGIFVVAISKLLIPAFKYHDSFAITLLAILAGWLMMGLVDSPYIKNDWSLFFWLIIALTTLVPRKRA